MKRGKKYNQAATLIETNKVYSAKEACEMEIDVDLIEIDLKQAFDYLGNITGDSSPEELITALFTKFCLGK